MVIKTKIVRLWTPICSDKPSWHRRWIWVSPQSSNWDFLTRLSSIVWIRNRSQRASHKKLRDVCHNCKSKNIGCYMNVIIKNNAFKKKNRENCWFLTNTLPSFFAALPRLHSVTTFVFGIQLAQASHGRTQTQANIRASLPKVFTKRTKYLFKLRTVSRRHRHCTNYRMDKLRLTSSWRLFSIYIFFEHAYTRIVECVLKSAEKCAICIWIAFYPYCGVDRD